MRTHLTLNAKNAITISFLRWHNSAIQLVNERSFPSSNFAIMQLSLKVFGIVTFQRATVTVFISVNCANWCGMTTYIFRSRGKILLALIGEVGGPLGRSGIYAFTWIGEWHIWRARCEFSF